MKYLITYDISNDKRRTKVSDLLEGYGYRVNLSVYECELTQNRLDRLIAEIEIKKLLDYKYDSLRFYHICKNCEQNSFELTQRPDPFSPPDLFI